MPDFTHQYNTPIPPEKQDAFNQWLRTKGRPSDYYDYDVQGFYLSGGGKDPRGHGPDTFKKPNHPTFSVESKYSTPQNPGGRWVDGSNGGPGAFVADPSNLIHHTPEDLQSYFKQVEPDTHLYLPPNAPGPPKPPTPQMQTPGVLQLLQGLFK